MSDDLLPLADDSDSEGFDVVMRGYDRRQVDDYVERVGLVLADAERLHAEDGARVADLEAQLLTLQSRLTESERRAEGLPDPASRVSERMTEMLRLAEEEAEQIVAQAQDRASASTTDRAAELDRREAAVSGAAAAAEQTRLEAQRDAETMRLRAQQETEAQVARTHQEAQARLEQAQAESDRMLAAAREEAEQLLSSTREQAEGKKRTAEEDVKILHEDSRRQAAEMLSDAERRVEELAAQRDTIAVQLQTLRENLTNLMQPLHPQPPAG